MATSSFFCASSAELSAFVSHWKCSSTSLASTLIAAARFFGVWNRSQSRSAANARSAAATSEILSKVTSSPLVRPGRRQCASNYALIGLADSKAEQIDGSALGTRARVLRRGAAAHVHPARQPGVRRRDRHAAVRAGPAGEGDRAGLEPDRHPLLRRDPRPRPPPHRARHLRALPSGLRDRRARRRVPLQGLRRLAPRALARRLRDPLRALLVLAPEPQARHRPGAAGLVPARRRQLHVRR